MLYSDEAFGRFVGNSRKQIDIHSSEEQEQAWRALDAAIKVIEHTWGSLQVRWGDVNKVSRRGVFPVGGADLFDTLHPDTGRRCERNELDELWNASLRCGGNPRVRRT